MIDVNGNRNTPAHGAAGFTLVELLVVVAIIALLVSILLIALANVRAISRKVMCMNQLHEVAFRFSLFADERQHPNRGDSERYGSKFSLEDFQESLYRISEFWDAGQADHAGFGATGCPLMCPSAPGELTRSRNLACSAYAVGPPANVSVGFNMRLAYVSTMTAFGPRLQRTRLTPQVKSRSWVPLAFDVDGPAAADARVLPYYAAPPAGDTGMYGTGRFWFPSVRHRNSCNVAFIGGHVLSAPNAERAAHWQWSYQPPLN